PVLHHRVGLAAVHQLVVLQLSHDRKQQRRMAWPFRPGLPEQFDTISIFQRTEFCAVSLNGGGNAARSAIFGRCYRVARARLYPSPDTTAPVAFRLLVCWRSVRIAAGVGGVA